MRLDILLTVWTCTILASATSFARNELRYIQRLQNPVIRTPSRRVNAFSHFDLEFSLQDGLDKIRLSLEPNEDAFTNGATISYLGADGTITHAEPLERHEHKIFKGTAWAQAGKDTWTNVGWARITVLRDGVHPLIEGAFSVHQDKHHIHLPSSFTRTKHVLDPYLEDQEDEYMVVWRDSDIAHQPADWHTDLKRDVHHMSCSSDELNFNSRPDHPVLANMMRRNENYWASTSFSNLLLGKRQIDTQGSGNGAGVNLANTIGQTNGCPTTRKVALVGVATDCGFTSTFNSTASARASIINIMNLASGIWESTFNISLGLQNLTISDANCPGTVQPSTPWNQDCTSSLDITSRLNLFSAWRGTLHDSNSHWTLLTKCPTGSTVGLAWLGQSCVHNSMSSTASDGTTETVSGANVVALSSNQFEIVAHETGHTFGAVHDCTTETCPSSTTPTSSTSNTTTLPQCCPLSTTTCPASAEYIMNPYTLSGITNFSPCTIGNICNAILTNSINTTCLSDNRGIVNIAGASCGNGIVEEGEECDCSGITGCGDDKCCDPTTCKFAAGAVCDDANEDCCNNCQYATNGTICRASTGTCDPAETCTGASALCPADVVAQNGQSCLLANSSATHLTCASGQCTSRNLQCQTVMAGYITPSSPNGNTGDIEACDANSCTLTCTSTSFNGMCYGLQQNLLDGTLCGSGGSCTNGVCIGSSFSKEINSWINTHRGIVIGIGVGVGILLLVTLCACVARCLTRSRNREMDMLRKEGYNGPGVMTYFQQQPPMPMPMAMQMQPYGPRNQGQGQGQGQNKEYGTYVRDDIPLSWAPHQYTPLQPQREQDSEQQDKDDEEALEWRPQAPSGPPPSHQRQHMEYYGGGAFSPSHPLPPLPPARPAFVPPRPAPRPPMNSSRAFPSYQGSVRYG